jgi:signal transduction histidine kinase
MLHRIGTAEAEARAPQPSLRRIDELLDHVRAAGLPVRLDLAEEPGDADRLPRVLDVSAYRVIQEALSNVLRHAGLVPTRVRVDHGRDALTVEVVNEPATDPPVAAEPGPGRPGGHGLIGMRERVGLFGGTLRAGPRPAGGYAVCATFPIRRTR